MAITSVRTVDAYRTELAQAPYEGRKASVSRVLFLVVVHVLPPKLERRRSTSRAYLSTSAVVLFTVAFDGGFVKIAG